MNRPGPYDVSGHLFFRLRDGSTVWCQCIAGSYAAQVVDACTKRRPGRKPSQRSMPWLEYGMAERTYYRRKKLGLLPRRKK